MKKGIEITIIIFLAVVLFAWLTISALPSIPVTNGATPVVTDEPTPKPGFIPTPTPPPQAPVG